MVQGIQIRRGEGWNQWYGYRRGSVWKITDANRWYQYEIVMWIFKGNVKVELITLRHNSYTLDRNNYRGKIIILLFQRGTNNWLILLLFLFWCVYNQYYYRNNKVLSSFPGAIKLLTYPQGKISGIINPSYQYYGNADNEEFVFFTRIVSAINSTVSFSGKIIRRIW